MQMDFKLIVTEAFSRFELHHGTGNIYARACVCHAFYHINTVFGVYVGIYRQICTFDAAVML